jgi:hypothetical protein
MANAIVYGFRPVIKGMGKDCIPKRYPVAASATIAIGDPVTLDTAGRVTVAVDSSSAFLLGVAATSVTSATVGDPIFVWDDPDMIFEAMVTTGALTNCYTTRSLAACFDLTGTTGAFYVDAATSSQYLFKCIGECSKDPVTGRDSAVGTKQMKFWKITPATHVYGTIG